jgi:hypothetical protein
LSRDQGPYRAEHCAAGLEAIAAECREAGAAVTLVAATGYNASQLVSHPSA